MADIPVVAAAFAAAWKAAEHWMDRAADAGNTDAMVYLGGRLQRRGDVGDLSKAEQWYRRAADAGNTPAMYFLGGLLKGRGNAGDLTESEQWLARAREREVPHLPLA